MSKAKLLDKIENPDIPGCEKALLHPPLPPPPPKISDTSDHSHSLNTSIPYSNVASGSYYISLPIQSQTCINQPWWIPSDTDSSEVYTQWYESAYKAALQAAQEKDSSGKIKLKYFKRKVEPVDPKVDAEKVANAQKELSALMKPLKCDLCNAVMNSTLQAKLHYQGKPHQKKVSMFLNQSAKKLKNEDGQVSSTTSDWNTYCEICKIWFTSQTDANQHYAGKKHLKAAVGTTRTKISKRGQTQSKIVIDPTGRFGIGTSFGSENSSFVSSLPPKNSVVMIPPVPQYLQPPIPYPSPLRCDLCGVSANRQDQLDTHIRGTKHLKMLKLHGLPTTSTDTTSLSSGPIDYSIYRTPSALDSLLNDDSDEYEIDVVAGEHWSNEDAERNDSGTSDSCSTCYEPVAENSVQRPESVTEEQVVEHTDEDSAQRLEISMEQAERAPIEESEEEEEESAEHIEDEQQQAATRTGRYR